MSRLRTTPVLLAALVLAWATVDLPSQSGEWTTSNGEWPSYHGNLHGHHYSPLDQINAGNFSKLELAWRVKTDNLGVQKEYKLEGTPIVINGVMYTVGGTRRQAMALDPTTGELRWIYGLREGNRAQVAPRQLSGRGVGDWTDGKEERIFLIPTRLHLVALNARTG